MLKQIFLISMLVLCATSCAQSPTTKQQAPTPNTQDQGMSPEDIAAEKAYWEGVHKEAESAKAKQAEKGGSPIPDQKLKELEPPAHTILVCTVDTLNVRDKPSKDGKVVDKLTKGITVEAIAYTTVDADLWWKLKATDGKDYWVIDDYVRPMSEEEQMKALEKENLQLQNQALKQQAADAEKARTDLVDAERKMREAATKARLQSYHGYKAGR